MARNYSRTRRMLEVVYANSFADLLLRHSLKGNRSAIIMVKAAWRARHINRMLRS